MSALPKSAVSVSSSASPRQIHPTKSAHQQKTQVLESSFILGVNTLLAGVGIYTLLTLVPHQFAQHHKLQALRSETEQASHRVEQLKSDYKRSFSAREQTRISEEQGYLTGEKKLKLNWHQP